MSDKVLQPPESMENLSYLCQKFTLLFGSYVAVWELQILGFIILVTSSLIIIFCLEALRGTLRPFMSLQTNCLLFE